MASAIRSTRYEAPPHAFRLNSNVRSSSLEPMLLYGRSVNDAVAYLQPMGLDPVLVLSPDQNNPLDLYAPIRSVDYPATPKGAYLVIEARQLLVSWPPEVRPALLIVLRLPEERTISRIGILGNLLLPPVFDNRGPKCNFGLPRSLNIYAVEEWPPAYFSPPPHPRDWRLVYSARDLHGLWGWTPITFNPVNTKYLIFVMRDLPHLYSINLNAGKYDESDLRAVHGISIQRLAVHPYEYGINVKNQVSYSPVASWQSTYNEGGFSSRYWSMRTIDPPIFDEHQSIYAEQESKYGSVDLLPSSLVGFPSHHLISAGSSLVSRQGDGYSGDVTTLDKNATSLVIAVTDDNPPFVEALLLTEKWPRGAENEPPMDPTERFLRVYYTDDPEVAFSTYPDQGSWVFLQESKFHFAIDFLQGLKVEFPHPVNARYYRLELVFTKPRVQGKRRFALTKLDLIRSRHQPIVACKKEHLHLDRIQIRLSGPCLLDDYGCVDGREIMDLVFEASVGGQTYRPFLSLRSLLDIRERTTSQFIQNARQTRAYEQQYHERTMQGSSINDPEGAILGTSAHTRSKQVMDTNSLQHTLSVTKQTMLNQAAQSTDNRINSGKPAQLINNLPGITTDRNVLPSPIPITMGQMLEPLSQTLGLSSSTLSGLPGLSSYWNNKGSLANLFGLNSIRQILRKIFKALLWPFGSLGGDSDDSAVLPNVPQININTALDLMANHTAQFAIGNPTFRPSASISGSFGGQFFAGGSMGYSIQLDSGKSTAKSDGSQGQINESLTYHQPDNKVFSDLWVQNSDVSRETTRHHFYQRDKEYVWKGKEIQYGGTPLDIVLITVPVGVWLSPRKDPLLPDSFRIRVGYLPNDVCLDVTFVGTAHPIGFKVEAASEPPRRATSPNPASDGSEGIETKTLSRNTKQEKQ